MSRLAVISLGVLLAASTARATTLAETARYLAGKSDSSDPAYTDYATRIQTAWKKFEQPNLDQMRTWWSGRAPAKYSTVFYPFGGPDIGNALVLFPDADSYLLFGLEPTGTIPDLEMDTAGLTELEASLSTILQVNYFFTKAMEKKLGKGSVNSVTGLLLFFLAMNECEVTGAKTTGHGAIPGVEITFKRSGKKEQTVRYFMVNVADGAKSSAEFVSYLQRQGRFVTMIKSASYLMHKEGIAEPVQFERIRSLILERSDFIVQDDSGVPMRLFARDKWKLQFHGAYEAPTTEFAKYLQRDLRVEMQRYSTGPLPFSYGYAYKQGESNVMIAERAP